MTDAAREHTEHGMERKKQLVDAAMELFAQHGYSATRISDIATRAGVAKGLLYWYFPTKRDLFIDLVASMRLELRRAQAAAMDPDGSALERIGQGTTASVRFMADHAAYFDLLDVERTDREVAAVLSSGGQVYLDDVRELIVEGQRDGDIVDGDPDLLAFGVVSAVSSYSASFRAGRLTHVDVDELAEFVHRWVTAALT